MFLRLEFPTFLTITLDPNFINDGRGRSIRSIYKSSTNGVGDGVSVGVLLNVGSGVFVGVGVDDSVGVGVDDSVRVGVLVGSQVDVGIGNSVGVTSINFFFQGHLDPDLHPTVKVS